MRQLALIQTQCRFCKQPIKDNSESVFCKECGSPSGTYCVRVFSKKEKLKSLKMPFQEKGFFVLSFLSGLILLSSTAVLEGSTLVLGLGIFLLLQACFSSSFRALDWGRRLVFLRKRQSSIEGKDASFLKETALVLPLYSQNQRR